MNNRGFTLIEVMLTTAIGLAMIFGIFLIPVGITDMHVYTSKQLSLEQDANIISANIYKDISKGISTHQEIPVDECIEITNMVNGELIYCFDEHGIVKTEDGEVEVLSRLPSSFSLVNNILTIYIEHDPEEDFLELIFFLEYPLMEIRGGLLQ